MSNRFKPKYNIKKGDQVVVIAGNDKDRTTPRQVLSVNIEKGRVVVEGVNVRTKHQKPSSQNPQGSIVKEEASIDISNVMLWDPNAKAPSKVKKEANSDGKSVRVFKKSGKAL